ncbi:MAG: SDR family oxidoreductase, partial [Pseudomonadota bacterium]
ITGGASGVGEALVRAFSAQGAEVYFLDFDQPLGEKLASELGAGVHFRPVDVTDPAALKAEVDRAADTLADLSIILNNVGNDARHSFEDMTPEYVKTTFSVNLDPVIYTSQAAIPRLQARGGGTIVNIGSLNWILGPADLPAYAAAKGAITALTKSIARQYGPEYIRANTIVPGWVVTEKQRRLWLTPEAEADWKSLCCLKDDLLPADVANLALFLASSASRMITGQAYVIDAGRT